ncbi:hypothetical protein AVEN_86805-1 [Araneus ventricosus]|uniref:Uncharacterized protein n=1 Tax=Araneus ventricosus TaxID=182803 RepID=A0A4Y2D1D8_ARAVE|nr:hypothetical protein AVEN_86805-1 [Araneus ventricosus]
MNPSALVQFARASLLNKFIEELLYKSRRPSGSAAGSEARKPIWLRGSIFGLQFHPFTGDRRLLHKTHSSRDGCGLLSHQNECLRTSMRINGTCARI